MGLAIAGSGMFLIFDAYTSVATFGNGVTTSTTGVGVTVTSTSTTFITQQSSTTVAATISQASATTTTTTSNAYVNLLLFAQDNSGNILNAGLIVVDGRTYSSGTSILLYVGTHTIQCLPLIGYDLVSSPVAVTTTLNAQTKWVCTYTIHPSTSVGNQTTTLTVQLWTGPTCTLQTLYGGSGNCYPLSFATVQLSDGQSTNTDIKGLATFTVNQNSQYTISANGGYGVVTETVQVGSTPTTAQPLILFTGLSIVRASIFGAGIGSSQLGILGEIGLGVALTIIGSLITIRSKGEEEG